MNTIAQFSNKPEISPVLYSNGMDPRPFLSVTVGQTKLVALLDTGATVSVIGKRGLPLLESAASPMRPVNCDVYTADGASQSVLGSITLSIGLNGVSKEMSVLVVPSLRHPLVLGVDFCRHFGIHIDFSLDHWTSNPVETATVNAINGLESLPPSQATLLKPIIQAYESLGSRGLGRTDLVTHIIDTGDALPIKQRYYPLSPAMQSHMDKELDRMLSLGVIRESNSPWSSPVLLVPKSSGEYRLCFDGRKLNSVTKKDAYPLPYISHILDRLRDAKYLSSIDLKSAFWQIPLEESSCAKTAFTVPGRGLYEFTRLPFGISNAPSTLQRLMDRVLGPGLESKVFVYLDDIIIVTTTFEDHLKTLTEVLHRLKSAGLTVNAKKCEFCRSSLKFLGFIVDQHGLRTDPGKVEAIVKYPRPTTATEVKRFMGTASWYRRFVPNFSSLAAPINDLLKGKKKGSHIHWTVDAEKSFLALKTALSSAPVLASPDFSLPFVIQTDASNCGIGAVLTQGEGMNEHAIAYVSRTLNKAERNYSVTERECLAVVFAIEKFRPYVEGTHFSVITDHFSLLWLMRMKDPNGKLARWAVKLQQFDFSLIHRPGTSNVVPDALSRAPLEVSTLVSFSSTTDKWYLQLKAAITASPGSYPDWRVEGENIYKLVPTARLEAPNLSPWKYVVPSDFRRQILHECHDSPLAAHMGFLKTLYRVSEHYYWPKMRSSILRYVTKCRVCLSQKAATCAPPGLMGTAKKVSFPWQTISIDLMGPLPRSTSGHSYLLVVADWFTKYPLIFPLRQATVGKIVSLIENEVFLMFGVPQTVMVDNGTQFKSKPFKDLMSRYQVPRLWFNAKYHPQVNFVERTNRIIKTALRSFVKDNHRLWDVNLAKIAQAIRTSVHEVTGYSPAFLNFGRHIPTSGLFYSLPTGEIFSEQPKKYADTLSNFVNIFKDVEAKLLQAHERNARHYNLRRRPLSFSVGDVVWKRNYALSDASQYFSSKLTPRYVRCTVHKKISPLTYSLVDQDGKNIGIWHVKDLKSEPNDDSKDAQP